MGNQKHETAKIRQLAYEAKKRILENDYKSRTSTARSQFPLVEQALYDKIVEVLKRNDVTKSPIAQIIDVEYMQSLNPVEQQRYILNISEIYRKIKAEMCLSV